jgi:V8-like Glu-specific endopeptidase
MIDRRTPSLAAMCIAILSTLSMVTTGAVADENVVGSPREGTSISAADVAGARAPDRTLTKPTQLTERIRTVLSLPNVESFDIDNEAHGTANHPFTTKRASSAPDDIAPVDKFPWSATGKLFVKFGNATFVCTASVIRKGLLVTAAHCVHNFGEKDAGFADFVRFEPARHVDLTPFGSWTAKEWWIPATYHDGTDKCSAEAPGIVCENDIAVVVLEKLNGKFISEETGSYDFPKNNVKGMEFGYTSFLGQQAAQITQLGYPSKDFEGTRMIRTDSLGYKDDPYNVVIGSNQTGGSSGGPWLQNFGVDTSFTGAPPTDNTANQVVATTSWGFTLGTVKVQGASRFSKNSAYTAKSNIESLMESACGANPDSC